MCSNRQTGLPGLWRAATGLLMILALSFPGPAAAGAAETPTDPITRLQAEVERLAREVAALRAGRESSASSPEETARRLDELERRIELLAQEIEKLQLGEAPVAADTSVYGLGPAASKVYRRGSGVSIGGYGELLYQHFAAERDDGSPTDLSDRIDLARAVLYFGYRFNQRFVFNSELEVEHAEAADDTEGEVGVEFAYLDVLWKPHLNARAGLLLVPMGFINELHEPTVFPSARRPAVERFILPSTWRENGLGLFGQVGGLSYRTYVVSGFDASGFSAEEGLREGRSEGSEAPAEDFAWVGRIDEQLPGLLIGASGYLGDAGQGLRSPAGRRLGVRTTIFEGHVEWRRRGVRLRALGAQADLSDVAELDRALGLAGAQSIGDRLRGGYVEAGYDLFARWPHGTQSLMPFLRWESYDTQSSVPAGFERDPANDVTSWTGGVAYQPIDQLILKLDFEARRNGAGTAVDQLDLALGWVF